MASVQCGKPAEKTCDQGQQQNHSLGEKVSNMVSSVFKKEQTHQIQCHTTDGMSATKTHGTHNGHGMAKKYTTSHGQEGHEHAHGVLPGTAGATNGTKCHAKSRRNNGEHKKRGLLQKIKDGISGNSDSSSSSSESEGDDDKCGGKKN